MFVTFFRRDVFFLIIAETFVAQFPYISNEPTDLTFNINDTIVVTHKDEEWWYGCIGDRKGIFPANYVKKVEVSPGQVLRTLFDLRIIVQFS